MNYRDQGGYPRPQNNQQSNYYNSIKGLSIVCAIIATLLTAPILAQSTEDFARDFIIKFYGGDAYLEYGLILWKFLCAATVFYLAKAFLTGFIVSLGVALASRYPVLLTT